MSKLPRILPLIGVAIAGVLAVNALAGARNLPDMVSAAKAMAEGITKPSKAAKAPKTSESAETPTAASPLPPSEANTQLAMASAPTVQIPANADALCLASRAGLSPNEMKMIQDLQSRRGELDQRETDLDTQVKLVEAAEAKLNAKLDQLNGLKGDINKLLGQVDDKQAAENARLIKVYSVMKPAKAAADMAIMSDDVRLPIAAGMKEAQLSAIIGLMTPLQAKELTEKLANRFAAARAVTEARNATAPPGAAPPVQQAAAPPAAPAAQAAAAPAKPAAKPKPKRTAANTKPKAAPAAAAAPKSGETTPAAAAPAPATG